jgi:hypothetical protein
MANPNVLMPQATLPHTKGTRRSWQGTSGDEEALYFSTFVPPLRQELQSADVTGPRDLLVRAVCAALEAFPPI